MCNVDCFFMKCFMSSENMRLIHQIFHELARSIQRKHALKHAGPIPSQQNAAARLVLEQILVIRDVRLFASAIRCWRSAVHVLLKIQNSIKAAANAFPVVQAVFPALDSVLVNQSAWRVKYVAILRHHVHEIITFISIIQVILIFFMI